MYVQNDPTREFLATGPKHCVSLSNKKGFSILRSDLYWHWVFRAEVGTRLPYPTHNEIKPRKTFSHFLYALLQFVKDNELKARL